MKLKTRIFQWVGGSSKGYANMSALAEAMGISVSQVYRVKNGERPINQKFIVGAAKAFPGYTLDALFYVR